MVPRHRSSEPAPKAHTAPLVLSAPHKLEPQLLCSQLSPSRLHTQHSLSQSIYLRFNEHQMLQPGTWRPENSNFKPTLYSQLTSQPHTLESTGAWSSGGSCAHTAPTLGQGIRAPASIHNLPMSEIGKQRMLCAWQDAASPASLVKPSRIEHSFPSNSSPRTMQNGE